MNFNVKLFLIVLLSFVMVVVSQVVLYFDIANDFYLVDYRLFVGLIILSSALLLFGISLLAVIYASAYIEREVNGLKIGTSMRINAVRDRAELLIEVLANKYGINYDQVIDEAAKLKSSRSKEHDDPTCKPS